MVDTLRPAKPTLAALAAFARRHRVLLAVLAVHGAVWALVDQVISPHPDFSDHWVQSRVFSWAYYQHPPMIAWLIRAYTSVFGASEPALETLAIGVNLTLLAAVYALAVRTFSVRAAVFTLLGLEATLYFAGGTPIMQTEQPLLLYWVGALAALLEYRRTGSPRWLLAMGALAGLGALSKYTMVLFYLAGLVYLVWIPARRRDLLSPWLYAAGLLSLLVFSPVLIWNAQHGWWSILYQLGKAGGAPVAYPGKHLLEFTFGFVMIFSPVLIIGGVRPLARRLRGLGRVDSPVTLLAAMAFVPVAFFALAMIRGSFPDPKWANVGFVSFFLLLGHELDLWWTVGEHRRVARLLGSALAVNAALIALIAVHTWHPFLPLQEGRDPTRQVVGWRETARQVEALLAENHVAPPRYVISFTYPLASQFALHMQARPLTSSLNPPERSQWSDVRDMTPENTILVCQARECNWVHRLVEAEFHWLLRPIGTVETRLWGVHRHDVTVMLGERIPGQPPPSLPVPTRP